MDRLRGDQAFYDEVFDRLDQHLERGAEPELMVAALGTKLAEVLARCIHGSHVARPQAEDWVTSSPWLKPGVSHPWGEHQMLCLLRRHLLTSPWLKPGASRRIW
jgi:hypothetical protein